MWCYWFFGSNLFSLHFKALINVKKVWVFENALLSNEEYVLRLEELINKVKGGLNCSNQFCDKVKWDELKYEICFTITFLRKSNQYSLESKLRFLESNLNCDINSEEYIYCKNQLEEIYDIAEGIKVRSKY